MRSNLFGGRTDGRGFAAVEDLAPARYRCSVRAQGYRTSGLFDVLVDGDATVAAPTVRLEKE